MAGTELEVTHINNNDNTIEGLRHKRYPAFSVQYHPEAAPGPHDSGYLFDQFLDMIREHQRRTRRTAEPGADGRRQRKRRTGICRKIKI